MKATVLAVVAAAAGLALPAAGCAPSSGTGPVPLPGATLGGRPDAFAGAGGGGGPVAGSGRRSVGDATEIVWRQDVVVAVAQRWARLPDELAGGDVAAVAGWAARRWAPGDARLVHDLVEGGLHRFLYRSPALERATGTAEFNVSVNLDSASWASGREVPRLVATHDPVFSVAVLSGAP